MDLKAVIERARTPGEFVWHYTTLDTLALILQSNALYATEVSFQNDIRETLTADAAFRETLEALEREDRYGLFARQALTYLDAEPQWAQEQDRPSMGLAHNARFILCASNDPDSLYAWRTYAHGGIGCAIGLDPSRALGIVDPGVGPSPRRVRHWRPVVYSPEDIRQEARSILTRLGDRWSDEQRGDDSGYKALNLIITELTEGRARVRAMAKDSAFADEHELRVTAEQFSFKALVTTSSSMGPRPHVRLVSSGQGRWGEPYEQADSAPKLPVRTIRLGPDAPDSADTATQWLLLANGYQLDPDPEGDDGFRAGLRFDWKRAVIIDRSRHPYRAK